MALKGEKISEETKAKMRKSALGRKFTEEHKKNLSKSLSGRKLSKEHADKIGEYSKNRPQEVLDKIGKAATGRIKTAATIKKMSESQKGRKVEEWKKKQISMTLQGITNEKDWNGFVSSDNKRIRMSREYASWRTEVFKKDNYTCQDCEDRSGKGKKVYLHAHHVMSFSEYPKYRFIVEFGHTLCKKCHFELHKRLKEYRKVS
jgi:5-methylcytosine-specific restriction endonuclease McrA